MSRSDSTDPTVVRYPAESAPPGWRRGLLPNVPGRMRAVTSALIAAVLLVALIGPATTRADGPPNLDRFLDALGAVESHGRYDAVNASSGALGKYQILPSNWRSWSGRYLGDPNAEPTPGNQETVARQKVTDLYGWLGDWASVAHWWLTGDGDTDPDHWSEYSRAYVNQILAAMGEPLLPARSAAPLAPARPAPATKPAPPAEPAPPTESVVQATARGRIFDESNLAIDFSGGWGEAQFARYNGGQVRYAVLPGATAWFTFTGSSITWIGPKGPTRGEADVYVDDVLVATVDVYEGRFRARAQLFSMTFDRPGTRTIKIEVVGTPGRETIAVDEFVVGD